MRDYVDDLERRLSQAAEVEQRRGLARRAGRGVSALAPRVAVTLSVSLGALLAVAVVLSVGGTTDRAVALPVLAQPATDATAVRSELASLSDAGARFEQAREIATPHGEGFVIPAPSRGLVCLAIPDVVPDSYGQTCVALREAARRGIVGTLIAPQGATTPSTFVAVLPEGATATLRNADGATEDLRVDDEGVARATVKRGDAMVTLTTDDGQWSIALPAQEPEGKQSVDCGEGRIVPEEPEKTYSELCAG